MKGIVEWIVRYSLTCSGLIGNWGNWGNQVSLGDKVLVLMRLYLEY